MLFSVLVVIPNESVVRRRGEQWLPLPASKNSNRDQLSVQSARAEQSRCPFTFSFILIFRSLEWIGVTARD
jgi:hypothetical protein